MNKHKTLISLTIAAAIIVAGALLLTVNKGQAMNQDSAAVLLETYCLDCHNDLDLAANLEINPAALDDVGGHASVWEKVAHKLNSRAMPPVGEPRPEPAEYTALVDWLEHELDSAAASNPEPGSLPQLHRLTRTEYQNAIRDLLAIENLPAELDYEVLLPADNSSSGFDNISDLLFMSPVIMERYLGAAQKIARLAVGDMNMPQMVNIHRLPLELPQDRDNDELALGSRGGFAADSWFPLDADYEVHVELASRGRDVHELEITLDGERVGIAETGGRASSFGFVVPVSAGPHRIGASFVRRTHALDESTVRVQRRSRGSLPAIELVTISGPYAATGPGNTPSRNRVFSCVPGNEPGNEEEQSACAGEILGALARRAYRRPPTDDDLALLMRFFDEGREIAGFDAGIQRALERLLVSPNFLYRAEVVPASVAPGEVYEVSPLELASRLSFFLWSSIPDDRLLDLAVSGELADDAVLAAEIERMLADDRAESLVSNFAAQWLFLRDIAGKDPDLFLFRDYDESLREAFVRETELFVSSVFFSDNSVVDLIDANYTFINERLAEHYGLPQVRGSHFRRVVLPPDSPRGGLLGHGSVLTLTSYPTRTSPVLRGKYVLDNLLAAPPPAPPPDVPALEADEPGERATRTLREAMAAHRANPECASCHAQMDPIGFAFEHFDAVGRWRESDGGLPIESASTLPDGTLVDGIHGVEQLLLANPERFVSALTEKLLMYSLGRNVQYFDQPTIRAIVRDAKAEGYTFASLVQGIVRSVPFRMRRAPLETESQSTGI